MSHTPDSQGVRSTPIPTELPPTPQPVPGPSENKESRLHLNPFLTYKHSEIIYEKKIRQRFGFNQELIPTNDVCNQTSDELSNAFSQTSNRSKSSEKILELNKSQSITTHHPVKSNASFSSYVSPVDPKTADYDVKKAQYYPQQYPQGQYNQPGYPPPSPQQQQFPGGFMNPAPQYNPAYNQGYQQGYQGFPPQQQRSGPGWKNIACIGSCVACLMLLCTSCCQAALGQGANFEDNDDD